MKLFDMQNVHTYLPICCFFTAVSGQFCLEDGVVDENLNDPEFVRTQLNCVLYDAKCDNFGHRLKGNTGEVISIYLSLVQTSCRSQQNHRGLQHCIEPHVQEVMGSNSNTRIWMGFFTLIYLLHEIVWRRH